MKREESLEVFVEVRRGEVHEVEGGGEVWEVLGKVAVAAVAAPEDEVRARDHLEAGSEQSVGSSADLLQDLLLEGRDLLDNVIRSGRIGEGDVRRGLEENMSPPRWNSKFSNSFSKAKMS